MNYQKIVCWGDSQSNGARTYGCYPLYLARMLNEETRYVWRTIDLSTNGHTARDLWFRLAYDLGSIKDVYQACVLIGTNDVGRGSPLDLFEEYYRQILVALRLSGILVTYCGEIPPIGSDGHAFFSKDSSQRRDDYNARIRKVVNENSAARLVDFSDLTPDCFTDPVHLNEKGNEVLARCFARAIVRY
jgi:lysophospholipase L1-like esterase